MSLPFSIQILIIMIILFSIISKLSQNINEYSDITPHFLDSINYLHLPLISAICITKNHSYIKRAIDLFHTQTYSNKQLIILYDIFNTPIHQFRSQYTHPNIKWIINYHKQPLGSLRNIAIDHADGTFIAQWDDDDEYHPKRLEYQYKSIQTVNFQKACCLSSWVIHDTTTNTKYISRKRIWEGSILGPIQLFKTFRYPNISKGEDTRFIWNLRIRNKIFTINIPDLYVYNLHSDNTWGYNHKQKLLQQCKPYNNINLNK